MGVWIVLVKTKRSHKWVLLETYSTGSQAGARAAKTCKLWPNMDVRVGKFSEVKP